jgi:serine-type D-Ala-D-Ala carboxypeptidase/endopeptidase (penicillin-binding protein 4)
MVDCLMLMMRGLAIYLLAGFLSGCSHRNYITKSVQGSANTLHHHAGFVLYDPVSKKTLASINGDKYFTPASNTKIFTLFAGLKLLGDSVPALRWANRNDSLIFWGTGDPSFMYGDVFSNSRTFNFLRNAPAQLFFSDANFFERALGPGWAWDDYGYAYQAERSALPVYGNLIEVSVDKDVQPRFFKTFSKVAEGPDALHREHASNHFTINKTKLQTNRTLALPFVTSGELTAQLLADTLKREVTVTKSALGPDAKTLYSMPVDSLYGVMMKASDNFIAEQILLLCAQKISDSLSAKIAIDRMLKEYLADLPDAPVWVDGSGLSRYNQMTPRSIVALWEKIYSTIPQVRLFPLLATNGENGTLRSAFKNQPQFIYGKTGSLSNNYSLSGYLVTKKKRVLIFSSMNANFVAPAKRVRDGLEKVLSYVYEHY